MNQTAESNQPSTEPEPLEPVQANPAAVHVFALMGAVFVGAWAMALAGELSPAERGEFLDSLNLVTRSIGLFAAAYLVVCVVFRRPGNLHQPKLVGYVLPLLAAMLLGTHDGLNGVGLGLIAGAWYFQRGRIRAPDDGESADSRSEINESSPNDSDGTG